MNMFKLEYRLEYYFLMTIGRILRTINKIKRLFYKRSKPNHPPAFGKILDEYFDKLTKAYYKRGISKEERELVFINSNKMFKRLKDSLDNTGWEDNRK